MLNLSENLLSWCVSVVMEWEMELHITAYVDVCHAMDKKNEACVKR